MKIVSVSDIHGLLKEDLPKGDILTISGDLVPANWQHIHSKPQKKWFKDRFILWCGSLIESNTYKDIIFIAGNHDRYLEKAYRHKLEDYFRGLLPDNVHYLRDNNVSINGINIYGTPWTPPFCNWHFMGNDKRLQERFSKIPENVDILLTHGPPSGFNDTTIFDKNRHIGSMVLTKELHRINPQYCIFGHIHTGAHNITLMGNKSETKCVNVSLINEKYDEEYKPFIFEID